MSLYVLMKLLERRPERYDTGLRILSSGKIEKAYKHLISHIKPGQKVLDIGCGTGTLSIQAALKGAFVKGIDINPGMLEIAKIRAEKSGVLDKIELVEMGVEELDKEKEESYDVVMSGLCFSELSENELNYTLNQIRRILKPGGLVLIADEIAPSHPVKKILHTLVRIPLKLITYLIVRSSTHPLRNFPEKLRKYGFAIVKFNSNWLENFAVLVGIKEK